MPCFGLFIVVGIWSWHQRNTWEEIWTRLCVEIWKWKYKVCKMWCSQSSSIKRYGNWFSRKFLAFSYILCFECSQQSYLKDDFSKISTAALFTELLTFFPKRPTFSSKGSCEYQLLLSQHSISKIWKEEFKRSTWNRVYCYGLHKGSHFFLSNLLSPSPIFLSRLNLKVIENTVKVVKNLFSTFARAYLLSLCYD